MVIFYWFGVGSKKLMILTYLDNKGDVNPTSHQIKLEQQNTAKYQLFDGL